MSLTRCNREAFVRAWMVAWAAKTGSQGVADATGLTRDGVFTKAARLRRHGVVLPKMRWEGDHDPRKLNRIVHAFLTAGRDKESDSD